MKKELLSLKTPSGENFNIENWNVYPRPRVKRDSFFCLNGEWDFCVNKTGNIPTEKSKKIIVPFSYETPILLPTCTHQTLLKQVL